MVNKKSILIPALFSLAVATNAASAGNNTFLNDTLGLSAQGKMLDNCYVGVGGIGSNTFQSELGCNFDKWGIMGGSISSKVPYKNQELNVNTIEDIDRKFIGVTYRIDKNFDVGIKFINSSGSYRKTNFDVINPKDNTENIEFKLLPKNYPKQTTIGLNYTLTETKNNGDSIGCSMTLEDNPKVNCSYTWNLGTGSASYTVGNGLNQSKPETTEPMPYDNGSKLIY
jgi:hypothetical protein